MSTTIVTTWATDISQLGPIYPFVGSEFLLLGLGLVFWLGFHILQAKSENKSLSKEESNVSNHPDLLKRSLTVERKTKG